MATLSLDPSLFLDRQAVERFECAICFNVVHQPPTLVCPHLFCRECVRRLPVDACICPTCREPIDVARIAVTNPYVVHTIENLVVRCEHHAAGCAATFTMGTGGRNIVAHRVTCAINQQQEKEQEQQQQQQQRLQRQEQEQEQHDEGNNSSSQASAAASAAAVVAIAPFNNLNAALPSVDAVLPIVTLGDWVKRTCALRDLLGIKMKEIADAMTWSPPLTSLILSGRAHVSMTPLKQQTVMVQLETWCIAQHNHILTYLEKFCAQRNLSLSGIASLAKCSTDIMTRWSIHDVTTLTLNNRLLIDSRLLELMTFHGHVACQPRVSKRSRQVWRASELVRSLKADAPMSSVASGETAK